MKKNAIKFVVPSLAVIIYVAVFLSLILSCRSLLLHDGDTGYHVRAGEHILNTCSVPSYDIFSHVTPALRWNAHEWLAEAVMAGIHGAFGMTGIVIFFSLLISLTYYLLFIFIKKESNIIVALVIILFILPASAFHWMARPHIFTNLFLVIWIFILETYQYKNRNLLYLMPPLMLLWANIHGGFIFGLGITGIYFIGNLINALSSKDVRAYFKQKSKVLGFVAIACFAVSIVNPNGIELLFFPFKLLSEKIIIDHVGEFLSPNFHLSVLTPARFLILFTIFMLAVKKSAVNVIDVILILFLLNMSLLSVRHITVFGIVISIILARLMGEQLEERPERPFQVIRERSDKLAATDDSVGGAIWIVAVILFVVCLAEADVLKCYFDPGKKPVAAAEFLRKENIKGNMYNNYEFGDYFIYSLYPQYKVFIDGRADMYGSEIFEDYMKVTLMESEWEDILKKYGITYIVYNADSLLSKCLVEKKEWHLIYADKVANIFVKEDAAYGYLIRKYDDIKPLI